LKQKHAQVRFMHKIYVLNATI